MWELEAISHTFEAQHIGSPEGNWTTYSGRWDNQTDAIFAAGKYLVRNAEKVGALRAIMVCELILDEKL